MKEGEPWQGGDQAPQPLPPAHPALPHLHRLNNVGENLEQAPQGWGTVLCIMQQCNMAEMRPSGPKKKNKQTKIITHPSLTECHLQTAFQVLDCKSREK